MSWQHRLAELALAGGALFTQTGCPVVVGCGNANPDPCICGRTPDPEHAPQCVAEKTCEDNGGYWEFGATPATDAGTELNGHCEGFPKDAGIDGPHADSSVLPDAYVPAD
jgi:hypothetical protein